MEGPLLREESDETKAARRSELARLLRVTVPHDGAGTRRYAAGTVVFREGDAADAFYFILAGRAAVYTEATPSSPIRLLEPGQGFGELALINDAARTASVRAESDLVVDLIPREQFLRLHEQSAEVRDRMAALSFVYRLPLRGVALQWVGRHGDQESIERTYRLHDGRTWSSTFLVGEHIFRLEATAGGAKAAREHVWLDASSGLSRTVGLDEHGRITALFGVGTWGRLPVLIEAALDGTPLAADCFTSFEATGAVHFEPPPRPADATGMVPDRTVCFCMQVHRRTIRREIRGGCKTFEGLRTKIGCGSVCGGCEPSVKELIGLSVWTPVTATAVPVRDDLRCFRLYPKSGTREPFIPGQHLVIEGFIDGAWVPRAYTIVSAPQETEYIELCVKREPEGLFSRWLFAGDLDEKDLHISAPRGDVRWDPGERPTVCFVGGIGITPALAIVRAALASRAGSRVHVDYSAHTASQLAFLDELQAAAAASRQITLRPRATDVSGRIKADEVRAIVRELPDADFHLCGPPSFMDAVREALAAAGVLDRRIKIEVFVHAVSVAPAPTPQKKPTLRAERLPPRARSLVPFAVGALVAVAIGAYYLATHFSGL